MSFVFRFWESLCQRIRYIVIGIDSAYLDISSFDYLSNEVISPKCVLGSLMWFRLLDLSNNPIIITIQVNWVCDAWGNIQTSNELLEPNSFLRSVRHNYILRLCRESVMVPCLELLQLTTPPYKQNTKPDCDLKSSWSDWNPASVYPLKTSSPSYPPQTKKTFLVLLKYLRIFLTVVQWLSPGSDWNLLVMLKAYATSGRVQSMPYLMELLGFSCN